MIRNERGVTLIETIIAAGILGIVCAGMIATVSLMATQREQTVAVQSRVLAVANLINDIRVRPEHYVKNYSSSSVLTDTILDVPNLPIAVSPDYIGPVKDCPNCPSRMGYVIRPLPGLDGIFVVTVRYAEVRGSKAGTVEDYEFLVVPK